MAYEYEKENIRKLNSYNVLSGGANITKQTDELQEAYRKAKAFDEVVKILDVYLGDVEDEINALCHVREIIKDMEDE